MRTAVIVVSAPEVLDDAMEWAAAGLVADSFWLSSEDASRIDPDTPNALRARLLRPRSVGDPLRLAESLSHLGSLDEIRVAWIRPAETELSGALKDLEHLLRELVPPDRVHWLDIVVPTVRTDATVVPLPGQWVQLRILAEDRSAPDVTDAGWDLNLDVPLHAALLAVGILGGTNKALPWGSESAARHYEMRGFSRVVLGAADVSHYADRFIGQEVPQASAGTVGFYPKDFIQLRGADAGAFADQAVRYVSEQDDGALAYRDPESSELKPAPKLTFWQNLKLYWRFLGFGLLLLLGKKLQPIRIQYSKHDFLDAGYSIDDTVIGRDRRVRIPDFDALDAQAAEDAREELAERRRELGHRPPKVSPNIWRLLTRLATSINDGGIRPEGWNPPERNERKPVLGAADVQPTPTSAVFTEVPELEAARNPSVAAAAVGRAAGSRHRSFAPLEQRTIGVATAQALIDDGNHADARGLSEQLDEIGVPAAPPARSLLDRLAAAVTGATLRSRLDADRWTEFATAPSPDDPLDWTGATRKFRKRTLIGAVVSLVVAIAWAVAAYYLREELPTWFRAWFGFVIVAAVFLAFLLWSVYVFYQTYSAFLERGRRRLEIRFHWAERAKVALTENARLRAVGPALDRWLDLLGALYPVDDDLVPPVDRAMPADAPKGVAVTVPVFDDREITEWLRDEAAEPGWRLRALEAMVADGLNLTATDAMKILVEDDGLEGGPLFDQWEQRQTLWDRYTEVLRDDVAVDVAGHFVDSDDRQLRVLSPPHRRDVPVTYSVFANEPWPAENEDDERWDDQLDFEVRDRLGHGRSDEVALSGDVCALAIRVQFRRLDVVDEPLGDELRDAEPAIDPEDY